MKLKYLLLPLVSLLTSCVSFQPSFSNTTSEGTSSSVSFENKPNENFDYKDPSTYWDETKLTDRNGIKKLDFYNLNDFHGAVDYNLENNEPGIAKLSTYIKTRQGLNPEGFVFTNSGDMWQGSASSNLTEGALVVDWLNHLNCQSQSIGNHEFDWGVDLIKNNNGKMNFPMLACNILDETTNTIVDSWVKPFVTLVANNVKIGIIGAIGRGLTSSISAKQVKGLDFVEPTNYVVKWADHLRENGADVVLYLEHDTTDNVSSSIINKVDAVFGGHTHQYEETNTVIPMIQSSCNGKALGHIEIQYNCDSEEIIKAYGSNLSTKASDIKSLIDDSETINIYAKYEETIKEINDRVVGNHKGGIDYGDVPYIYNAYAYKYFKEELDLEDQYEIFAVETNNARSDIIAQSNGDITYGSVYKALPFDNSLVLVRIKGSNILNVLCDYSSAKFSVVGIGTVNRKNMSNYVDTIKTYYMLMINYISDGEFTAPYVEVIADYNDDASMPRNIVAKYLNGYPNNVTI